MSAALEISNVSKAYGGVKRVQALSDLSFTVPEGSLFGLIGPNGAGKTTLFSIIAGFLNADAGSVSVRGRTLGFGEPRSGYVAVLPQDAEMPAHRSVSDVLVMLGRLSGLGRAEAETRATGLLGRLGISDLARRRLHALSHGQRRRVHIAQAFLREGEIVLLDEPTAGLDPIAAAELRAFVKEMKGERTIVFSSHNLGEVAEICDHAAMIDKGRLAVAGSMDELRRSAGSAKVRLGTKIAQNAAVLDAIRGLDGIRGASVIDDGTSIDLQLAEGDEAANEETINQILSKLIEHKVPIKSVDRGQSLEARFLEEAGKGSGPAE